ncbi:hypothetical protein A4X13_0g2121 [Tilletia indica]|uniref:Uncharacterized protein n=1 Tax=Tilletia indica TaxID=43049 RepID=A0A177THI0_9BASI|nr:hypothetical protein A4X13_0g2121 [Tilletia indica]
MTSISFYVPPPTPTPLPPNRPATLRDDDRARSFLQHTPAMQMDSLPGHLKEALVQVEKRMGLRILTIVQDDEEDDEDEEGEDKVKITTFKLTMQAGQRLTLILYLGTTEASEQANTYATLLRALHHLTTPTPMPNKVNDKLDDQRRGHNFQTPLRILPPLAILESSGWTAIILEDLSSTLNFSTSTKPAFYHTGTSIRACPSIQGAGRLSDIISPEELSMLQSHILEHMDDLPLPSHISSSSHKTRIARLQVIQQQQQQSGQLKSGSQRKDSAVAGLGYSPESAFRTNLEEAGRRSRATRTFETSPERKKVGGDGVEEGEVAEMLVDIELLCHPSTRSIRLAQGTQTLYLELHPTAVRRLTAVQLLSDRA